MTKTPHHPLPDDDRAEIDRVPESRENTGNDERGEQRDQKSRTYGYPDGQPYKA